MTEVVLHSFAAPPNGANPLAGVIRDAEGNLYGTASSGGAANQGVVYKLDADGHETVLYSFTGAGAGPISGVIRDSAGNLYGTGGGTGNAGVVYKLDANGHETVLYSFTGGADGGLPFAGVIRDSAGNLYGTTQMGGSANQGVVYKLDPAGHLTVLHNFAGGADGSSPAVGVIRDAEGNLYGTTPYGGSANQGVVYKLDAAGLETVLHSFTGGADGAYPYAGVIRDAEGNLYGTASSGGICGGTSNGGLVYKLDAAGHETVLYCFTVGADGTNPNSGVIRDSAGNLYGTTYLGGTGGGTLGDGVVYKLDAAGHETVLYSFTGAADGQYPAPVGGVIRDSAGNLYGATVYSGPANIGMVYKIGTDGRETTLYGFPWSGDGGGPVAGVFRDSAGNLYGTTGGGGALNQGTVYKLDAAGHETVLYSFTGGVDGGSPQAGVILDSAGNVYGTASGGGTAGDGVVYKLHGTGYDLTVLHSFTGGADGAFPDAGVILDSAGNLYGTTPTGSANQGAVYKLHGSGYDLTVLHSFTGGAGGGTPSRGGLIRDSAGNLYGTTYGGGAINGGVVYKLHGTGYDLTVLHSFTGAGGANPSAGVIQDPAGNLYGTTTSGGALGAGTVYKLDASGHETVLYSLRTLAPNQVVPGVIRDPAGNLYGTTFQGGKFNFGTVFEVDASGNETILYSFTGGADGGYPEAGVIRDAEGNLYGTTSFGGKERSGVVFKLEAVSSR